MLYQRLPRAERGPLRVMFIITSMPVGGAETLLVNLIRRMDRAQFEPEVCCLKERGPLGEELAGEVPVHCHLLAGKFDPRVLPRLAHLLRRRKIDAVITVGAGDKMFWGRLAARLAGVPVICAALHSTGWPDGVGKLNRKLTPITDAFIGVAGPHGRFLVEHEKFPREKVVVIPNGIDTERFAPLPYNDELRRELGLARATPIVGIVAALRPEKNHELFLQAAALVLEKMPQTRFLVVGDGLQRKRLEMQANGLQIARAVLFLGNRSDVPQVVSLFDVFTLTSHNEANPVSILEAMALGKPVVATEVGSVAESVKHARTGYLTPPGDRNELARRWLELLYNPLQARSMGDAGRREVLAHGSLDTMVAGYEQLLNRLYDAKYPGPAPLAAVDLGSMPSRRKTVPLQ